LEMESEMELGWAAHRTSLIALSEESRREGKAL
jgi:hypothetical protein